MSLALLPRPVPGPKPRPQALSRGAHGSRPRDSASQPSGNALAATGVNETQRNSSGVEGKAAAVYVKTCTRVCQAALVVTARPGNTPGVPQQGRVSTPACPAVG